MIRTITCYIAVCGVCKEDIHVIIGEPWHYPTPAEAREALKEDQAGLSGVDWDLCQGCAGPQRMQLAYGPGPDDDVTLDDDERATLASDDPWDHYGITPVQISFKVADQVDELMAELPLIFDAHAAGTDITGDARREP